MGSDWTWELQLPGGGAPELVVRRVHELAVQHDLRWHRPDGLINLFTADGEHRTVADLDAALAAMATGDGNGQFWTADDVDVFVTLGAGCISWSLDAVHCYRRPVPEADSFRRLHRCLTDLWLAVALQVNADGGRVLDEWSIDQVWGMGIHNAGHPVGGWPAELGWSTYLRPDPHRPTPPLPDVAARTRRLANGALLVTLLDDPAAVDPVRYEDIHKRWLSAR